MYTTEEQLEMARRERDALRVITAELAKRLCELSGQPVFVKHDGYVIGHQIITIPK